MVPIDKGGMEIKEAEGNLPIVLICITKKKKKSHEISEANPIYFPRDDADK